MIECGTIALDGWVVIPVAARTPRSTNTPYSYPPGQWRLLDSVRPAELRVGDFVPTLGAHMRGWTIEKSADQELYAREELRDGKQSTFAHSVAVVWEDPNWLLFGVARPLQAASAPVAKKVGEYPGHYTRCGLAAYLGAFEVAHENEAAALAKNCPAPRARRQ